MSTRLRALRSCWRAAARAAPTRSASCATSSRSCRSGCGRDTPIRILCGTSVGAINACLLAAYADPPRMRARLLVDRWRALQVEHILKPDPLEFVTLVRELIGVAPKPILGKGAARRPDRSRGHPAGAHRRDPVQSHRRARVVGAPARRQRLHDPRRHRAHRRLRASPGRVHPAPGVRTRRWSRGTPSSGSNTRSPPPRSPSSFRPSPSTAISTAMAVCGRTCRCLPRAALGADRLLVVNPHYVDAAAPDPVLAARARSGVLPDRLSCSARR